MLKTFKEWLASKEITDYAEKEAAEMAKLHNEYTEYVHGEIQKQIEGRANKEDITSAIDAYKTEVSKLIPTDEVAKLEKQVTDLVDQVKNMRDTPENTEARKSFEKLVEEALTKALPEIKKMKNSTDSNKELVIEVKAAVNVTTAAIDNASGATTPVNYVYGQVTDYSVDNRPDAYIVNFISSGKTNKASLPYMDKVANEGTMAITDEGELKPLISISFELRYSTAEKIAGRTKVSEEALDDIPNLMAIIRTELKYEHDMAEQTWIFTKINAFAPAFVAGGMATSTDDPSNWDALRAAAYAVKIQSNGKHIPNLALVKSADAYNMGATKDANGQYVIPTFVLPDGSRVAGMRVFEVNDDTIADGTFIVGDFRKLRHRIYKGFTIRIGQGINFLGPDDGVQSDFESNMYTILGESRQHLYIYENEKIAFVKATFAAVKTAIEAPAA